MKINFQYRAITTLMILWAVAGCHNGKPAGTAAGEGVSTPEKDSDGDQIPDGRDECPAGQEIYNGYHDEDGCPDSVDPIPVENIVITPRIFFKQGESSVQEVSFQILDEIVGMLKAVPQIKRVRIEGHIDPSEKAAGGPDISLERAKNVMDYMVSKEVEPARLEAVGLGDTTPAADAEGDDKAQYNRRVEFEIIEVE